MSSRSVRRRCRRRSGFGELITTAQQTRCVPSPLWAGLSHVADEIEKEGIVPTGAFDFLTHGYPVWMRSNDIESESSQDREVLRGVVFSGSVAILVEQDIEHPMQSVFDAPMTAHNLQQPPGGDVFGKHIVAHGRLVGRLAMAASARGDASHGNDARKAVRRSHAGVANDCSAPGFVAVVSGRLQLLGDAALAGAGKTPRDGIEQFALILLERQRVMAATSSTVSTNGRLQCSASPVTMQPSSDSMCRTSSAPLASLRPGALREARAIRASVAKTLTICNGVVLLPRS